MTPATPSPLPDRPLDAMTLRSADALVTAIPYLLGFTPRESVVVVWLRDRRILLTQRIDLAPADADEGEWLSALVGHPAAFEARELVLVFVTDGAAPERLVTLVMEWAAAQSIAVRDAIRWNGRRWWSLLCVDQACCPDGGREVSSSVASAVAAEFTLLGSAPLPDRASVARTLDSDDQRVRGVVRRLEQRTDPGPRGERAHREQWRDNSIERTLDLISKTNANELSDRQALSILEGLADVRVRDTVLWECARMESEQLRDALGVLSDAVRCAPPGLVAPVATACAIVAWILGDGTRALIATGRALHDDPAYSLAILVEASLNAGLPPQAWREATAGLARAECRHGSEAAGKRSVS